LETADSVAGFVDCHVRVGPGVVGYLSLGPFFSGYAPYGGISEICHCIIPPLASIARA